MSTAEVTFHSLNLAEKVQSAVDTRGYTVPTPIQAQTIPHLLEGRDVLGQASTGTGKTAAFALPLLSRIDLKDRSTQVLVLCPTRELAIQVATSFSTYGEDLPGLNVQPIYGGASYTNQIRELKRGCQVVVGTPGRVMDHMRRGTLNLQYVRCLVLDEADEMLRMGFVDDVKWILEQTPPQRQVALFSATMPDPIRRIANEHLKDPATVTIRSEMRVANTIRSRYLVAPFREKTGALIRILETEKTDGVIVFVKTRETTLRVADDLVANGYSAIAINGDIVQKQREHTIEQLKNGKFDILVATDVAARGLDVQRISHVINYDLPHDSEAWIHRIGRTGRAGREGEAILFLTPGERRHLRSLERSTRQTIEEMEFPSSRAVNERRKEDLKERLKAATSASQFEMFKRLMSEVQQDTGMALEDLVAATAVLMQGDKPFFMKDVKKDPYGARSRGPSHDVRGDRFGQSRDRRDSRGPANSRDRWEDQRSRPGRDQQGHRDWQESRSSDSRHDSRGADRRSQNFGSPDDRSLASPGPQTRHHERTGNGGYGNAPRHETPRSVPVESDVQQPLPVMEIPKSVTHEGVTVPSNPVVVTPVVSTTVVSTAVTGKQHVIKTRADASMFDPPTPVQATSFNSDPAIPPSDAAVTGSATPPPVGDSFATRDFRRPPVETGPASDRGDRRTAPRGDRSFSDERPARGGRPSREDRNPRGERPFRSERPGRDDQRRAPGGRRGGPEKGMETFRLEVGHEHGVQPGNIVGAIANEAGIDSRNIGRINIQDDHCYVDLPVGMPPEIFRGLKDVIVMGRHLRITRSDSPSPSDSYRSGGSGSRGQRPGGDQRNHGGHRSGPPRRDGEGGGFRGRGQGDREQRSFRPADRGGRADGGRPEGGRSEGRPGRDAGGFRGGKGPRGNKFRK